MHWTFAEIKSTGFSYLLKLSEKKNNVFFCFPPQHVLTLPIEEICKEKKIGAKTTKDLVAKQNEICKLSEKIQADEKLLDIFAKGCLARFVFDNLIIRWVSYGLHIFC